MTWLVGFEMLAPGGGTAFSDVTTVEASGPVEALIARDLCLCGHAREEHRAGACSHLTILGWCPCKGWRRR